MLKSAGLKSSPDADASPLPRPPPRTIPFGVGLQVLLGRHHSQFGCVLLLIGGTIGIPFAATSDLEGLFRFRGNLTRVTGRITDAHQTNISVGGGKHRKGTPVQAYDFTFADKNGVEHRGRSFVTQHGASRKPGQTASIEFVPDDPGFSRIMGMRRRPMSNGGLIGAAICLLLAGAGAGLAASGLRHGLRDRRLLRHGRAAWATLQSKRKTKAHINKQSVYALTFAFKTDDGRDCTVTAKTHEPRRLEDERRERVLYDPLRPTIAAVWDDLPGPPRVTDSGDVAKCTAAQSLKFVAMPLLTAAVLATAAHAALTGRLLVWVAG